MLPFFTAWLFAGILFPPAEPGANGDSLFVSAARAVTYRVTFNRDIRPILSANCFFCHGPDPKHREADLRLDVREAALADHDGRRAIVPGKPEESELLARITSHDADLQMPPPDSNKKLTALQIETLREWIADGAEYQPHWAYAPLEKPSVPAWPGDEKEHIRNDIDRILFFQNAKYANVLPAVEADPRTLLRRLSFDLTGLPPTADEVKAFVRDYGDARSEKAYEAAVDRLLASPHFGERMAAWWLDLVRYADTVGYHGDQNVTVWPFRDYVIRAFNANMPFDWFTIEQLAGDLLPEPTRMQQVAAGYNRLGMMTAEGGAQDKEYLAKYAAERVRNASTLWLGATMGCAECHDHKFDPITTRDFYSFASFFADIKEKGFYGGSDFGPKMLLSTAEQDARLKQFDADIANVQQAIAAETRDVRKQFNAWVKEHSGTDPDKAKEKQQDLPADVQKILRTEAAKRTKPSNERLFNFYLEREHPQHADEAKQLKKLQDERKTYEAAIPSMLAIEHVPPRTMRILPRGNWMDDSGETVLPAVPAFLRQAGEAEANKRLTRLDLTRWIMSDANPLTARVFANRLWAMFFGAGLSKRLDDFGAQGDPPVHPQLLEYLAATFRDGITEKESGSRGQGSEKTSELTPDPRPLTPWNIKAFIKLLVMSRAYRQASAADEATLQRDPFNRAFARQARFRLPAEGVRDAALSVSGLLVPTLGGRSVRPYQPAGYYAQLNFPKREYEQDTGENLWRRSLYTHWQRTFLHPAMAAFDAPTREECTCDRVRSNTPLQALVLLNDPEFVEAARTLAERTLKAGSDGAVERLFRTALQRTPTAEERKVLVELFDKDHKQYETDAAAARSLVDIGESPAPSNLNAADLAALTSVARAVLNLHEFVTRE
jgi:hypothetical protein